MDNRPVNSSPQHTHQTHDNASKNSHPVGQHETLHLPKKGYTVGKPKIWGLKLCRALFSLGGLIHRPKKYFDQLIDEKRTTPTQNPISDRRVTNPKENSDSHSTRALPPKPEPFTSSKPAPSPRPSKTELPVSGNQYENVKFPETMDVSSPDKPATPGLSSRGKITQESISSLFSLLESLPPELNKVFPERATDQESIDNFKELASKSKTIGSDKSLNHPDNRTKEAKQFKSVAAPKYKNIHCHKDFCASPGKKYHATHINMPNGRYIAAQGPTGTTEENFLHLLRENNAPISVALIGHSDLTYKDGRQKNLLQVGPEDIGKPKIIPAQVDDSGNVISKEFEIELLETTEVPEHNFRIDKLKIDGKTHFRINEMGWKDFSAGNPARLVAIPLIIEMLRQQPEVVDRSGEPIVVNCNAGVGRTGTFITANDTVRQYLEQDGHYEPNFDNKILEARERRNNFVQTDGQYSTLNCIHKNLPTMAEPIIEALGMKKTSRPQEALTKTQSPVDNDLNTSITSSSSPDYANLNDSEYSTVSGTQVSRLLDEFNEAKITNNKFQNEAELVSKLEKLSMEDLRNLIAPGNQTSLSRNIPDNIIKNKAILLVASAYGKKKATKYIQEFKNDFQKAKEAVRKEYERKNSTTYNAIKNAALQEIDRQLALSQPPETSEQETLESENPYVNLKDHNKSR